MVTAKDLLQLVRKKGYQPRKQQELAAALRVEVEEREPFEQLLQSLVEDGYLLQTRSKRYSAPEQAGWVRGTLQGSVRGFGFLVPDADSGVREDIYIKLSHLHGALDRDTVLARVLRRPQRGQRAEGEVMRIVRHGREKIVGTFCPVEQPAMGGWVVPDDKRLLVSSIAIPAAWQGGAVDDTQKVVVKLHRDAKKGLRGEIVEVVGIHDEPGVDVLTVIRKHDLPVAFPEPVLAEAQAVCDAEEKRGAARFAGRRDLRDRRIVTIDGDDAKDLDDAVSLEQLDDRRVRLGVHIADVSHYVQRDSELDKEAARRGCSVYLLDRVLPMLPSLLSDRTCSLQPGEPKLTLTCDMEMEMATGKMLHYELYPSFLTTTARATYNHVRAILRGKATAEVLAKYPPALQEDFQRMDQLASLLRARRLQRGAIDFDISEASIQLDEAGKPSGIHLRPRTEAERLIEEFMLLANECVASHLRNHDLPLLYRVHERPDEDKLERFYEFSSQLGYPLKGSSKKVKPRTLQQLLAQVKGKPEEYVVNVVLLRSMKQARYTVDALGHFGLATTCYTHFTSPIRRYPDLLVHRILRQSWIDPLGQQGEASLAAAAEHASVRERVAVEAEREVQSMKKVEYMLDKVDVEYDGLISGVTLFGFFVSLPNTIEGLVHISSLHNDYYVFHAKIHCLVGERTGKVFRLGDPVRVVVERAHLADRRIDFRLLGHQGDVWPPPRPALAASKGRPVRPRAAVATARFRPRRTRRARARKQS